MQIQDLIDRPHDLMEFLGNLKPEKAEIKSYGEVFTPIIFINKMLDSLSQSYEEKYGENIFEDPTKTWFDPANGMSNFPLAIFTKLMIGLKVFFPDERKRKKHIIENMLYMSEINPKNCFVTKKIFNSLNINLYEGDSLLLDTKKEWNIDHFDIIIGNPPYNDELTDKKGSAIYTDFINSFIDRCQMLCFITPSKCYGASGGRGKGLDVFKKNMLNRKDLVFFHHFEDAKKIFGNSVDIKGGVNYFLKDSNYYGDCLLNGKLIDLSKHDILIFDGCDIFSSIIEKLVESEEYKMLSEITNSQSHYKIETNDKRLKPISNITYNKGKFIESYNYNNHVICFVSQKKGAVMCLDSSNIKSEYLKDYKVLVPDGAHGSRSGFGQIILANPYEVHTKTYISFIVKSKLEAESLVSFLKSKLANVMLSARKSSQHTSAKTCSWIPLPSLDQEWTDQKVYNYFELTNDQIEFINKEYTTIKSGSQLTTEDVQILREKIDYFKENYIERRKLIFKERLVFKKREK